MGNQLNIKFFEKYYVIDDVRFSYYFRGGVKQIMNCYINWIWIGKNLFFMFFF